MRTPLNNNVQGIGCRDESAKRMGLKLRLSGFGVCVFVMFKVYG